jgi:hypothetical protein
MQDAGLASLLGYANPENGGNLLEHDMVGEQQFLGVNESPSVVNPLNSAPTNSRSLAVRQPTTLACHRHFGPYSVNKDDRTLSVCYIIWSVWSFAQRPGV